MQKITVRTAIRDAIREEMLRDEKVFLIGEEVGYYNGAYKTTQGLLEEFGDSRVIDTPITEYGFAGIGVGAAMAGLRPIVEFMTFNFAMQAIDHIVNSAAKTNYMSGGTINCPIVFRGPNGAPRKVGAQHSQCFASWFANIPGLKVVAPYTSAEAKGLLKSAIRDNNPVVVLEHEMLYGREFEIDSDDAECLSLDKAIIMRSGTDITITAYSNSLSLAIQAADILASEHNISVEVINLISIRPIDANTIVTSVKKTGRIMHIDEGWQECGIGSQIATIACTQALDYLDHQPIIIGASPVPMPYASKIETASLPSIDKIVDIVKQIVS